MNIQVFPPDSELPTDIILPTQTHSTNILEVKTGTEDLTDCDGIWTKIVPLDKGGAGGFSLGVKTADCAPIVFWDDKKFGIIHAGWRGLVGGIVEKMCETFPLNETNIWVGPLLPIFEIQKDDCYDQIHAKFGDQFFMEKDGQIFFNFKAAISHLLPSAEFDPRSTFDTVELASWRRDRDQHRNITVIST